jgi:histidine ammonia-lyase
MNTVTFGEGKLSIEDVVALSRGEAAAQLSPTMDFAKRIEDGARFLDEALAARGTIYGVTTGYGDSCTRTVPQEQYSELPIHLTRFHGCGLGDPFDPETTRAILAVRLNSLCQGYSGVGMDLLRGFENLLHYDVLPIIPQEGSVGASGDLTPLSYVAAVLIGEREVRYGGRTRLAAEVLRELGLTPLRLRPKEGLAVMNGTAAMTAVACIAFSRSEYLSCLACRLTAMASLALKGNAYHFNERLFAVKPHPGQMLAAAHIRHDLGNGSDAGLVPDRLQDPYSIRCAPHVIGVLFDALPFLRGIIETELNSANDNPIIDPASRSILHGGHFYGGHIAFAMDSLKNAVANIADLMDRQLAVLVDEKYNRGLPPNLSGSRDSVSLNHGFKAVQIGSSAWTAEALKATMPASVFSRSTECHNQDKVSMGTIAARDCIRVLELAEQVAAALLLGVTQAVNLRVRDGELSPAAVTRIRETVDQVNAIFPLLDEDRALEPVLRLVLELILRKHWRLSYGSHPSVG